jgi:hypothetical protein
MPEKCCRRNYPHTKMAEENNEHIDQFFREQFDQVEVRYNAAHWDQLQNALAAAGAAGAVASTSDKFWVKLKNIFGSSKAIVLTVIASMIVIGTVFFINKKTITPAIPGRHSIPPDIPVNPDVVIVNGDTIFQSMDSKNKEEIALPRVTTTSPYDTTLHKIEIQKDSLDSVNVDTTKLKNFIFW